MEADNDAFFSAVWQRFDMDFREAIQSKKLQEAHRIWCRAAEDFLIGIQDSVANAKNNYPKRGIVLPMRIIEVASSMCQITWGYRDSFCTKIDDALGLINDIKNRIRRLNKGHEQGEEAKVTIHTAAEEGKLTGTKNCPSDYDNKTAATTVGRLWKKLRCIVKDPAIEQRT